MESLLNFISLLVLAINIVERNQVHVLACAVIRRFYQAGHAGEACLSSQTARYLFEADTVNRAHYDAPGDSR